MILNSGIQWGCPFSNVNHGKTNIETGIELGALVKPNCWVCLVLNGVGGWWLWGFRGLCYNPVWEPLGTPPALLGWDPLNAQIKRYLLGNIHISSHIIGLAYGRTFNLSTWYFPWSLASPDLCISGFLEKTESNWFLGADFIMSFFHPSPQFFRHKHIGWIEIKSYLSLSVSGHLKHSLWFQIPNLVMLYLVYVWKKKHKKLFFFTHNPPFYL